MCCGGCDVLWWRIDQMYLSYYAAQRTASALQKKFFFTCLQESSVRFILIWTVGRLVIWQHLPPAGVPPRSSTSRPSHPGTSLIKSRTWLLSSTSSPSACLPLRLCSHQRPLRYQIADNSLIFPSESRSEWVPCASSRQPCSPAGRFQRTRARTQTGNYSEDSLNKCFHFWMDWWMF